MGAFRSATFFVLPSHQENFGIAVVEALAASAQSLLPKSEHLARSPSKRGWVRRGWMISTALTEGLRYMCDLPQPDLQRMRSMLEDASWNALTLRKRIGASAADGRAREKRPAGRCNGLGLTQPGPR